MGDLEVYIDNKEVENRFRIMDDLRFGDLVELLVEKPVFEQANTKDKYAGYVSAINYSKVSISANHPANTPMNGPSAKSNANNSLNSVVEVEVASVRKYRICR